MSEVPVTLYAYHDTDDRENERDAGEEAGLTGMALEQFTEIHSHDALYEITVKLMADEETGEARVTEVRLNGQTLVPVYMTDLPAPREWPCQTAAQEIPERLVSFLYELLRDHAQPGDVEQICLNCRHGQDAGGVDYTNPHLEAYARSLATFLTA